jgi:processive 1,2-diacylglycerol beta-glucosyltransferase
MKIFIVYASAGAGHRKAAEAIFNSFRNRQPCDDVKLIDILEKTNFLFAKAYAGGYQFLINRAVWLWAWLFNFTAAKGPSFITPAIRTFDILNSRRFSELILREQPDLVISTHFMPPEILTYLKLKGKIKSRLITVITDFGVHPLWVSKGTDAYAVASSLSKEYLIKQGVKAEDIRVSGIPIDEKFSKAYDKQEARKKIGLDPDKFTLLITTGSFGIGPVEEIIACLHKEMQIIVVCAKNVKLYKNLQEKMFANTKIFGFVDNINELMAACDIVIAKPGGLTTSEILSMELVPVFISPIPGQETHNLMAMQEFGIGKYASSAEDVKNIVLDYRDNPEKMNKEKEIIKKVKKPHAAADLYNAVR